MRAIAEEFETYVKCGRLERGKSGSPGTRVGHWEATAQIISVLVFLAGLPASAVAQQLAVDHVWIHVDKGAPEAAALVNAPAELHRLS